MTRSFDADLPQGLSIALARRTEARERYARLAPEARQALVEKARQARSGMEMQALVDSLLL